MHLAGGPSTPRCATITRRSERVIAIDRVPASTAPRARIPNHGHGLRLCPSSGTLRPWFPLGRSQILATASAVAAASSTTPPVGSRRIHLDPKTLSRSMTPPSPIEGVCVSVGGRKKWPQRTCETTPERLFPSRVGDSRCILVLNWRWRLLQHFVSPARRTPKLPAPWFGSFAFPVPRVQSCLPVSVPTPFGSPPGASRKPAALPQAQFLPAAARFPPSPRRAISEHRPALCRA